MSTQFTVDANTQQMRTNAEELRSEAQAYHQCSQQVLDDGRALGASWEGEAKTAYMELLEKDAPEFLTLYQELTEFCDAVVESANAYDQAQSRIASEMHAINRR